MKTFCTSATRVSRHTAIARGVRDRARHRHHGISRQPGCQGDRRGVQHGHGRRGRVAARAFRDADRRDRAGRQARGFPHTLARGRRAGDDRHACRARIWQAAGELRFRRGVRHPALSRARRPGRERGARSDETRALVQRYVRPIIDKGADIIVLGCTHYPFLRRSIQDAAGPAVEIIDPATAVARELRRRLESAGLLSDARSGHRAVLDDGCMSKSLPRS